MVVLAPAKVNLTLAVLSKRPDGFHEIESLVVAVTLCDELVVSDGPDSGLELTCDGRPDLPCDSRNLVRRAAEILARRFGVTRGGRIHLSKRIPIGAGLGGGSSDAAATLWGLNHLWGLGLGRAELAALGAQIGSDVPFFFYAPAAVITGRGEKVRPASFGWRGWIVLVLPEIALSTAEVYARWREEAPRMGPPSPAQRAIDSARGSADELAGALLNMLEPAAFALAPELRTLHRQVEHLAARPVRLSGSGSAMFTIFDRQDQASEFAERVRRCLRIPTCLVRPLESYPPRLKTGTDRVVTVVEPSRN